MQRRIGIVVLSAVLIAGFAAFATAEEGAWMDMAGCDMCKHLGANPEMLNNMTWNHYDIKDGIMSVCTVTDEYAGAYAEACTMMDATSMKMMAGEEIALCNMCTELSGMMMAGAGMEKVDTDFGNVNLATSDDEAMVARLHAWAEKTRTEMAKMDSPKEKE